MKKKITKPFSIEAYKNMTNDERVETRDGRPARVICTDRRNANFPVIALYNYDFNESSCEDYEVYTSEGRVPMCKDSGDADDLVIVREIEVTPRTGWLNLWKNEDGNIWAGDVFDTKDKAMTERDLLMKRVATIQVNWEE